MMAAVHLKDPGLLVDKCFVGGHWIGVSSKEVLNPATGEVIARVPSLNPEECAQAIEQAGRAFRSWSKTLAKERSAILRRWFELVIAAKDDLAAILTSEQGKPIEEARGEISYAASFIEFFAEEAKRLYGETIPTHRLDAQIVVSRQPVGVVAAITPWNFPAAMITRKVAPALAAGCTVVVKPAPETPLTAFALAKLAERAGLPAGTFNVITGDAAALGQVMTSHQTVRFVSFTGSTAVGKLLMQQASSTVKKVGLELGGNAAFIVFDDADIDDAVEGAIAAKFRNMGQTCVCANRFYVQDRVYDEFVKKLSRRVAGLRVGNGLADGVEQGPLINGKAVEKVKRHISDAVALGAKVVVGGAEHALGGSYFAPTVLSNMTHDMLITKEETFGPVAPVYRFKSEAEVVELANSTPFGLAAYLYARDVGVVLRVANALESGMVGVNTGAISTAEVPFGGIKESGIGREGSRHGIEEYTELKFVLLAGLNK